MSPRTISSLNSLAHDTFFAEVGQGLFLVVEHSRSWPTQTLPSQAAVTSELLVGLLA
jgi:hypothetical protein